MSSHPRISAYVPYYNARASIAAAVDSVRNQTVPVDEFFVIDDGSTDRPSLSVLVIRNGSNLGRGATRAKAMEIARGELVLGCDATLMMPPSFLEGALQWFKDDRVAAVFGRIEDAGSDTLAHRWRCRHIFRMNSPKEIRHAALLSTGCSVIRKAAADKVGGFNWTMREKEDHDLGNRLLQAGFDVVFDPALYAITKNPETVFEVLDRYARWNTGPKFDLGSYARQIWYSARVMAMADLRAHDPLAMAVSLLSPHYQFWYAHFRSSHTKGSTKS